MEHLASSLAIVKNLDPASIFLFVPLRDSLESLGVHLLPVEDDQRNFSCELAIPYPELFPNFLTVLDAINPKLERFRTERFELCQAHLYLRSWVVLPRVEDLARGSSLNLQCRIPFEDFPRSLLEVNSGRLSPIPSHMSMSVRTLKLGFC